MKFLQYSDYIEIVTSTNDLFDYWFFQKELDCNPQIFSSKKSINKLPVQEQTKNIISLLREHGANEDFINIFKQRKEIEESIFNNKKKDQESIKNLLSSLQETCRLYH